MLKRVNQFLKIQKDSSKGNDNSLGRKLSPTLILLHICCHDMQEQELRNLAFKATEIAFSGQE